VLDNADDPDVLDDFWPVAGFGSVLVTTRHPSTTVEPFPFSENFTLEELSTPDAMILLKRLTQTVEDSEEVDNAAKTIVQRVDGLPLAIDQIASSIRRRHLSLTQFAVDYARPSDYHKLYNERRTTRGYGHSLGSVWAVESLEAEDKTALLLLSVLAMLDPASVPEEVILRSLGNNEADDYPKTKNSYNDILVKLIERSLVRRNREDRSLSLHRLVQDVARARMSAHIDNYLTAFKIAYHAVAASFPSRDEEMNTAGSIER
jgi:hypothetical protein